MIYVVLLGGLGAAAMAPRLRAPEERNLAVSFALGVLIFAMWQWDAW